MLKQIRCDSFIAEYQTINFNDGLNTVLGSTGGNNAIGKSTFLQIIDYAFGGEEYSKSFLRDIKAHIGDHKIFFTFEFPEQPPLYFYRIASNQSKVFQCDKAGHLIEEMTLDDYRKKLFEAYAIGVSNLKFEDICSHFFRIYGREKKAIFPSVQSTRSVKQLEHIKALLLQGYKVCYMFVALSPNVKSITLDCTSPFYAAFLDCIDCGMSYYGCSLKLQDDEITIAASLKIEL